jgi:Caspase domain
MCSGYLLDTHYVYNMDHASRGKMIIVSNRYFSESSGLADCPRHGTEFDAENLRATFSGLGFECEIHEDKTCGQMLQLVINGTCTLSRLSIVVASFH